MASEFVSGELLFYFWSELLLLFLILFGELIFCQGICGSIRSQIPPVTTWGKQELSFCSDPICWKLLGVLWVLALAWRAFNPLCRLLSWWNFLVEFQLGPHLGVTGTQRAPLLPGKQLPQC